MPDMVDMAGRLRAIEALAEGLARLEGAAQARARAEIAAEAEATVEALRAAAGNGARIERPLLLPRIEDSTLAAFVGAVGRALDRLDERLLARLDPEGRRAEIERRRARIAAERERI